MKEKLRRKLRCMAALSFLPCKWGFHKWITIVIPSATKFTPAGEPPKYYFGDFVQCDKCNIRHKKLTEIIRNEKAAEFTRHAEEARVAMASKPLGEDPFQDFKDGYRGIDPARQTKKGANQ